jgi:hypothetical protein
MSRATPKRQNLPDFFSFATPFSLIYLSGNKKQLFINERGYYAIIENDGFVRFNVSLRDDDIGSGDGGR